MDKNVATAVEGRPDESVCNPEVFPHVFARSVLNWQVKVLEVLVSRRVGLARHVKDVSDAQVDQFLSFESGLERSHVDTTVHFD